MTGLLKVLTGVLNLIFGVFKLLPVRNKTTFISRQANEKTEDFEMLGRQLAETAPDMELVFLCRRLDGGLAAKAGYCFHMLTQMYHIATSRVVVLDSYCICVSVLRQRKSLTVIQMWHALGSLKKFGLSIVGDGEGADAGVAKAMSMHANYTYVLTSGQACLPNFAEAFGYGHDAMKVMSLPRVDKLTDAALAAEVSAAVAAEYPQMAGRKVVVYAPTFRKGADISAEIVELAAQFDSDEYVFVLKKHPLMSFDAGSVIAGSTGSGGPEGGAASALLVDEKFTTIEMMYAADYVICDYSAVVYEAAVMGKPLFFYTFDYDSYGVDRDFYIDYKAEMPGFMSPDAAEVAGAVKEDRFYPDRVAKFAHDYVEHQSGCTEALAEFVASQA